MQLWLLAAHARGALPLVGAACGVTARKANHNWGVTARKANHNASNARGVTAGKMVCVSVKYRQTWHAYADGPGDGSYLNKFDPHPFQKSGKFHELPRKSINIFYPPRWEF